MQHGEHKDVRMLCYHCLFTKQKTQCPISALRQKQSPARSSEPNRSSLKPAAEAQKAQIQGTDIAA
jgi:hypothetical protein